MQTILNDLKKSDFSGFVTASGLCRWS